jgi:hypothetical protein
MAEPSGKHPILADRLIRQFVFQIPELEVHSCGIAHSRSAPDGQAMMEIVRLKPAAKAATSA